MLISSVGAYAIAKYLRGSPYMPWIGFVYLMGHLSVNHIARQAANNPRSVDITGAQMVLVMKLSAFCWNVADGALPESELSPFQKDRRLPELPSLLDYAGYVFFFPSMLIGPAFDFVEYRRWLDTTMFEVPTTIDPAKKPPTRRKRKIPRSATPAILKLVAGILWTVAFLKLSAWYSPDVLLSEQYLGNGILRRIFVLHMVGFTARCKYYGVWTMTEGACILTGLGYNGVDPATGRVAWNRLQNISPWRVEFAQNTRGYLEAWNINTNKWLRNYVYLRVTPKGKKPGFRATLATFTTSAFWHGFYPGYYLSFVLASFVQTVAKSLFSFFIPPILFNSPLTSVLDLRRNFRPFFLDAKTSAPLPSKKYYDLASWLVTQLTFSFVVAPFFLLGFNDSLTAWARVYFYAMVGTAGCMIFFASPAKKQIRKALEKRNGSAKKEESSKEGQQLKRVASTESLTGTGAPVYGISQDLEKEMEEAFQEAREGVARARALSAARKEL